MPEALKSLESFCSTTYYMVSLPAKSFCSIYTTDAEKG